MSNMTEKVIISPDKYLLFDEKTTFAYLKITNTLNKKVAFKIKSNAPRGVLGADPKTSTLGPYEYTAVKITRISRLANKEDFQYTLKVQYVEVPRYLSPSADIWNSVSWQKIATKEIRIGFSEPSATKPTSATKIPKPVGAPKGLVSRRVAAVSEHNNLAKAIKFQPTKKKTPPLPVEKENLWSAFHEVNQGGDKNKPDWNAAIDNNDCDINPAVGKNDDDLGNNAVNHNNNDAINNNNDDWGNNAVDDNNDDWGNNAVDNNNDYWGNNAGNNNNDDWGNNAADNNHDDWGDNPVNNDNWDDGANAIAVNNQVVNQVAVGWGNEPMTASPSNQTPWNAGTSQQPVTTLNHLSERKDAMVTVSILKEVVLICTGFFFVGIILGKAGL